MDSDGCFINAFTGWTGRIHDQRLFTESPLGEDLNNSGSELVAAMTERMVTMVVGHDHNMPFVLVADSAYTPHPFVLPCYKDTQASSAERARYNTKVSKARVVVEQAYGVLKKRWRVLLKPVEVQLSTLVKVVIACCVLHNFCWLERQPEPASDSEFVGLMQAYALNYPGNVATPAGGGASLVAGDGAAVSERGTVQREKVVQYVNSNY